MQGTSTCHHRLRLDAHCSARSSWTEDTLRPAFAAKDLSISSAVWQAAKSWGHSNRRQSDCRSQARTSRLCNIEQSAWPPRRGKAKLAERMLPTPGFAFKIISKVSICDRSPFSAGRLLHCSVWQARPQRSTAKMVWQPAKVVPEERPPTPA